MHNKSMVTGGRVMSEELKPCPFCGQTLTFDSFQYDRSHEDEVWLGCCAVMSQYIEDESFSSEDERKMACRDAERKLVQRWNTRHEEQQPEEL